MATYIWKRVNSSVGLKIRSGPGTSFAQIGAMTNQDVVEVVSLPQSGWYRIVQWYKGTTKQTLPSPQTSCWAHGDYLVNATIPAGATPTTETTEPAPVAKVVKQVAHFDDGTTVETFPDA